MDKFIEKIEDLGYTINENGTIYSPKGKKLIPNGKYMIYSFFVDGRYIKKHGAQLLATKFFGCNGDTVRHIDGDKSNCSKSNLEWVTTKTTPFVGLYHGNGRVMVRLKNGRTRSVQTSKLNVDNLRGLLKERDVDASDQELNDFISDINGDN